MGRSLCCTCLLLPLHTQVIRMVGESQEAVGAGVGGGSGGSNKMPTLEEYGTNLTRQAEEVGRGVERATVQQQEGGGAVSTATAGDGLVAGRP
jgi:hypothetical protein